LPGRRPERRRGRPAGAGGRRTPADPLAGPGRVRRGLRRQRRRVRACYTTERAFDAAILALSEPLASTVNLGLARDGAHLAVVFVSAGDDTTSTHSAAQTVDVLRAGRAPGMASAWALIGPSLGCAFSSGGVAAPGDHYWALATLATPSYIATRSVCLPDTWGALWSTVGDVASASQAWYALAAPAFNPAVRWIPPSGLPQELHGWDFRYDPTRPAIVLRPDTMKAFFALGGSLEVTYRLTCD
jgi:hypothetical protein